MIILATLFFISILGGFLYKIVKRDPSVNNNTIISVGNRDNINSDTFRDIPMFIKTWTLEDFYKGFDKMQYGNPINSKTGERFKSCAFYKKGQPIVYVGFYNPPGELPLSELISQKDTLKVGLKGNGRYLIYTGEMPYIKESDPIDLGI